MTAEIFFHATRISERREKQEEFGARTRVEETLVSMSSQELEKRLSAVMAPILAGLEKGERERKMAEFVLESVKISLGISIEGKIFVASGGVEGGLEVEFKRKGA